MEKGSLNFQKEYEWPLFLSLLLTGNQTETSAFVQVKSYVSYTRHEESASFWFGIN